MTTVGCHLSFDHIEPPSAEPTPPSYARYELKAGEDLPIQCPDCRVGSATYNPFRFDEDGRYYCDICRTWAELGGKPESLSERPPAQRRRPEPSFKRRKVVTNPAYAG
jgi:hypothetical protein